MNIPKQNQASLLGFHCADTSGENCRHGLPTSFGSCQYAVGSGCINVEAQKDAMRHKIELINRDSKPAFF